MTNDTPGRENFGNAFTSPVQTTDEEEAWWREQERLAMKYDKVLRCDCVPSSPFEPMQLTVPDRYESIQLNGILYIGEGVYFEFKGGKFYRVTIEEVDKPDA